MQAAAKIRSTGMEATTEPKLSAEDLEYFCDTIGRLAGIALRSTKQDLIKSRVRTRLSALGLDSYTEYRRYLSGLSPDHSEWQEFINLLTTNKTDFFREPKHFEYMISKFLPEWLKRGEKTLKIWSAAASTGEEPYTIAMILNKHLPKDRDFKILASDIDTDVLKAASNGVYSDTKKSEIPLEYHAECIDWGKGQAKGWFRIKSHLKDKVTFKRHNLIEMSSPGQEVFDLIFCRNVFIYFAPPSIESVVRKFYYSTKAHGQLYIGHSESLQNIKHDWELVGPSTFRKGR